MGKRMRNLRKMIMKKHRQSSTKQKQERLEVFLLSEEDLQVLKLLQEDLDVQRNLSSMWNTS